MIFCFLLGDLSLSKTNDLIIVKEKFIVVTINTLVYYIFSKIYL